MVKINLKKAIGLPLTLIYVVWVIYSCMTYIQPDTHRYYVYSTILDIIVIGSWGYITFSKKVNLTGLAKYVAYLLMAISLVLFIRYTVSVYWDITIFGIFDSSNYAYLMAIFVYMICVTVILWVKRVWIPTIIFSILNYSVSIFFQGYVLPRFYKVKELSYSHPEYDDSYHYWYNLLEYWNDIQAIIVCLALLSVIIWLFLKSKSPSVKSNPIDII